MHILLHLLLAQYPLNTRVSNCTLNIFNEIYSRSYAEDVTSVTSGASQGPHSFNLVFVCLFVCLFVSRLALSRICPVLYRTSKDSWPQYFCLFVPSTCLALSRTCPVPSRVRYPQENEYIIMRSVSGECIQCSNILCGFGCEAEIPLAGWLAPPPSPQPTPAMRRQRSVGTNSACVM